MVNRLKKEFVHDTVKNYTVHYDQTWIFDKIHHEINQVWRVACLDLSKLDLCSSRIYESMSMRL